MNISCCILGKSPDRQRLGASKQWMILKRQHNIWKATSSETTYYYLL